MSLFDAERFWSKVHIGRPDECWLWKAGRSENYGEYWFDGKNYRSHVIAFAIHHGIYPTGCVIRHLCNTRLCCNPSHLIDGTLADNNRDVAIAGTREGIGPHYGTVNSATCLTEDDVKEIRRLGLFFKPIEIARMPNFKNKIRRHAIGKILRGETWKELLAVGKMD